MQRLAGLMTGWLSFVVIGTSALTLGLQSLIAFRWMDNRTLKRRVAELKAATDQLRKLEPQATPDLNTAEIEAFKAAVSKAEDDAQTLRIDLRGKKQQMKEVERERDRYKADLAEVKRDAEEWRKKANEASGIKDGILTLYRESERKLGDLAWLRRIADEQAKNIRDHVTAEFVTYPNPGELVLDGPRLLVTVGVRITNESVFDITIRPEGIAGRLSLNNYLFKEPAGLLIGDFRGPIENLPPKEKALLILEQPLRQSEAETIKKYLEDNARVGIWTGDLQVPILVKNATQEVAAKPLKIISKTEPLLLNDFKRNTNNS